jgi:hypothetical protein
MFASYLAFGFSAPDLLHFIDESYGVHLLHMDGIDLWKTECIESFAGQLAVVADEGEQLVRSRNTLAYHVSDLTINLTTGKAFSECAAEKVLFG